MEPSMLSLDRSKSLVTYFDPEEKTSIFIVRISF